MFSIILGVIVWSILSFALGLIDTELFNNVLNY